MDSIQRRMSGHVHGGGVEVGEDAAGLELEVLSFAEHGTEDFVGQEVLRKVLREGELAVG